LNLYSFSFHTDRNYQQDIAAENEVEARELAHIAIDQFLENETRSATPWRFTGGDVDLRLFDQQAQPEPSADRDATPGPMRQYTFLYETKKGWSKTFEAHNEAEARALAEGEVDAVEGLEQQDWNRYERDEGELRLDNKDEADNGFLPGTPVGAERRQRTPTDDVYLPGWREDAESRAQAAARAPAPQAGRHLLSYETESWVDVWRVRTLQICVYPGRRQTLSERLRAWAENNPANRVSPLVLSSTNLEATLFAVGFTAGQDPDWNCRVTSYGGNMDLLREHFLPMFEGCTRELTSVADLVGLHDSSRRASWVLSPGELGTWCGGDPIDEPPYVMVDRRGAVNVAGLPRPLPLSGMPRARQQSEAATREFQVEIGFAPGPAEGNYLSAGVDICGVPHRMRLLRVLAEDDAESPDFPLGFDDPNVLRAYAAISILTGAVPQAIAIPGHSGRYVCAVFPQARRIEELAENEDSDDYGDDDEVEDDDLGEDDG